MIFKGFEDLLQHVRKNSQGIRKVAIVRPEDKGSLDAVVYARKEGLESLLVGDETKIARGLEELGEKPDTYSIVGAGSDEDCVFKAAQAIDKGEAHIIMKGLIETPTLMRTLFKEACHFRTGKLISHICFVKLPTYHKMLVLTDTAINVYPSLEQKRGILENAVEAMVQMGFDKPMVAVLAATEHVSDKMPETVDADALQKLNEAGEIRNCVVEGPLSYDLAISKRVAEVKKFPSQVAGNVDLMVLPNIAAGNILLKAMSYSANAERAGIVVGGRVPMVLPSRGSEGKAKFLPMVLAAAAFKEA